MPTHVRHVFLTGFPGVGKTTTMLAAIDELGKAADALTPCGFYTAEIRDGEGKRCGFDVVTFPSGPDACRAPLARLVAGDGVSPRTRHRVGRYAVDVASLEALACPALRGDVAEGQKTTRRRFVAVDEIGKMECLSSEFERAAWEALESPETVVLGSIPVRASQKQKQSLARSVAARPDVAVVRVTETNRDALRFALVDAMKHAFANDRPRERDDFFATVPIAPLAPFLERGQSSKFGLERTEEERSEEEGEEVALSNDERRVRNADALVVGGDAHRRLFGDSDEPFPPPRTLLLGETSSPAPPPTRPELAYAERSMWRVLDEVLAEETERRALAKKKDGDATRKKEKGTNRETTRLLAVFRAGLAVWDVVADVHVPGERRNKSKDKDGAKTKTASKKNVFNDVLGFLHAHPSVTRLVFVGERARRRFRSAPGDEKKNAPRESRSSDSSHPRRGSRIAVDGRTVDAFVVRSARGDEHERREKVREWSEALFGGDARGAGA